MLKITVPSRELWDEEHEKFIEVKGTTLQLEHSLVSVSKWESKWHKAFLGKREKTSEEVFDYIRCMTLTQNVDPMVFKCLTNENIKQINEYIENPMSATYIQNYQDEQKPNKDVVTAELIYYWMITLGIPFECQKWHLNRLIALIHVCNIKNKPPKKMSKSQLYKRNNAINNARRKAHHSKG